jgi:hypothetical protein
MRPQELPPEHPQAYVDNLLIDSLVGGPQREEIKHWRGLRRGPFGYNEIPTSSCHTFLLEGASIVRRAFFLRTARPFGPSHRFAI